MYWIVGKNGMLAQALIAYYTRNKHPFVATSSKEVDVTNEQQIRLFVEKTKPQYVINAAAYTNVDQAESEEKIAFAVNALGPKHLSQLSKEYGFKLIHISTDFVFDGLSEYPYQEDDVCNPINVYGMTKFYGEHYSLLENPESLVIRTSWLYGRGGYNFPDKVIDLLKSRERISVVDDQCSAPTYVDDLCEAIELLKNEKGIIHFSNSGFISRYIWTLVIFEALSKKMKLKCKYITPVSTSTFINTTAQRPLQTCLRTEKYEKITRQSPKDWLLSFQSFMESKTC